MGTWGDLPAELRLMVLEIVSREHSEWSEPHARVGYAVVCKEWQLFWEEQTFRRLILNQYRVADLERIVGSEKTRRTGYLKYVCLCVELAEYDCSVCHAMEDTDTLRKNDATFSRALWKLLEVMSSWRREPDHRKHRGLVLELGAYSPSDTKHDFRDFRLEKDYPYLTLKDFEEKGFSAYFAQEKRKSEENDAFHQWKDHYRVGHPTFESKKRLMGTRPLELSPEAGGRQWNRKWWQRFPLVDAVTGLRLRRQFYRNISADVLSKLFDESLTQLVWIRHERWRDVDDHQQSLFDSEYTALISSKLPDTLRCLFLHEDFDFPDLHDTNEELRTETSDLGKAISKRSRKLEKLSASFVIDASDFFQDFWPSENLIPNLRNEDCWTNLRTLILTASALDIRHTRDYTDELLMAAGTAAFLMPKLEVLELWTAGYGHASYFRYSTLCERPKITSKSYWDVDMVIEPQVIELWQKMARRITGKDLEVSISRLSRPKRWETGRKPWDYGEILLVMGLRLVHHIMSPFSARQLVYEGARGCLYSRG